MFTGGENLVVTEEKREFELTFLLIFPPPMLTGVWGKPGGDGGAARVRADVFAIFCYFLLSYV
jgi:hypothetical protein